MVAQMPVGVLLDTHALVWMHHNNPKLGPASRRLIADALDRRALFISAAAFWEVAWTAKRKKIMTDTDLSAWRRDLFALGLREIPMDGEIALRSVSFKKWDRDLFDCLFAATAAAKKIRLVTADSELLKIKMRGLSLADARK